MIEKVCAWCGGPVAPSSDSTRIQKYCSAACRDKAAAERAAAYNESQSVGPCGQTAGRAAAGPE